MTSQISLNFCFSNFTLIDSKGSSIILSKCNAGSDAELIDTNEYSRFISFSFVQAVGL